jgi:hypothetical protein
MQPNISIIHSTHPFVNVAVMEFEGQATPQFYLAAPREQIVFAKSKNETEVVIGTERNNREHWLLVFNLETGAVTNSSQVDTFEAEDRKFIGQTTSTASALAAHFLEDTYVTKIALADLSEASCKRAILKAAELVRQDVNAIIWRDEMISFRFVQPDSYLNEQAFFEMVVERKLDVKLELRELLRNFTQSSFRRGDSGPWTGGEERPAAFGYPMHALAKIDADAFDLLRRYVNCRDQRHDLYCSLRIVPDYSNQHGWRSKDALSFGVYFLMDRISMDDDYSDFGVISAAEGLLSAKDFASVIVAEAKEAAGKDFGTTENSQFWYVDTFCEWHLNQSTPYHDAVIGNLETLLPRTFLADDGLDDD